ncbi:hypothetical protein GJAV_G00270420 [Gymnothorax javanicus]|nr:hypothetical protein GJAV_G00270420 [Gymnothorax javanicus]
MENGRASSGMAGSLESSVEYKLLTAFAQKRGVQNALNPAPGRKERRRKRIKRLPKVLRMCVGGRRKKRAETVNVSDVADRLSSIVDTVDLTPGDIEADGPDDITQRIVELLRESGDQLDKKLKQDKVLAQQFSSRLTYAWFEKIATCFLQEVAPPDAQCSEQARIALACEVTRKLTAVDCHPMNMVMGFGAKYLREHYSIWVQQHGGWEKALADKAEDEIE